MDAVALATCRFGMTGVYGLWNHMTASDPNAVALGG